MNLVKTPRTPTAHVSFSLAESRSAQSALNWQAPRDSHLSISPLLSPPKTSSTSLILAASIEQLLTSRLSVPTAGVPARSPAMDRDAAQLRSPLLPICLACLPNSLNFAFEPPSAAVSIIARTVTGVHPCSSLINACVATSSSE
ncbi:hypothetical protein BKA70DRAFT_1447677 [Coprinopsis sp. MPI-PUGE-AT-0042]|nr:hypothetical protein BKA70DRAFT_1447677 [Coprinopsis sp. MPI-PUGE-AT-0042]